MKKVTSLLITIIGLVVINNTISAHHAMEYIEIESYYTPRKGEFVFHVHYDYIVDDKNNPLLDHWELTPGFSYGITERLMCDVHTHFAKFGAGHLIVDVESPAYTQYKHIGPSPFIEAAAFTLQYRVTEKLLPIDIAVALKYEHPFPRSEELLGGQQVYEGTLILFYEFGTHSNICFNFSFGKDGDENIKNMALGVKMPASQDPHGIAAGIEFLVDDYENITENWYVLPGIYAPLNENAILKTGLGVGKDANSMRANVSFMYRF